MVARARDGVGGLVRVGAVPAAARRPGSGRGDWPVISVPSAPCSTRTPVSQRSATFATTRLSRPLFTLHGPHGSHDAVAADLAVADPVEFDAPPPRGAVVAGDAHVFGAAHSYAAQVAVDVVRVDAMAGTVVDVDTRAPAEPRLAIAGDADRVAAVRRDVAASYVVPRDLDVGATVDDDRAVHGAVRARRRWRRALMTTAGAAKQEVRLGHAGDRRRPRARCRRPRARRRACRRRVRRRR